MKRGILICLAIVSALFLVKMLTETLERPNITNYSYSDYPKATITYSTTDTRSETTVTDSLFIRRFFDLAKRCSTIKEQKFKVESQYLFRFSGKQKAVFSISETIDNRIIFDNLTLTPSLIGTTYDGEPFREFLGDLKKLEFDAESVQ